MHGKYTGNKVELEVVYAEKGVKPHNGYQGNQFAALVSTSLAMTRFTLAFLAALLLIPPKMALSLFGVGVYRVTDQITVNRWSDKRLAGVVSLTGNAFEKPRGLGVFLYIDAVPFIDLEASFEAVGQQYDFQLGNMFANLDQRFLWGRLSCYVTLSRKLFNFGIPLLGSITVFPGGGINYHNVLPLVSINILEEFIVDNLQTEVNAEVLRGRLIDYFRENRIRASGYHFQLGMLVKLLSFNVFANYRLTQGTDIVPGSNSGTFSSLQLGLALGL